MSSLGEFLLIGAELNHIVDSENSDGGFSGESVFRIVEKKRKIVRTTENKEEIIFKNNEIPKRLNLGDHRFENASLNIISDLSKD